MKKKQGEGEAEARPAPGPKTRGKGKSVGNRFSGKPVGKVKNELKTVDQIRKTRMIAEKKKLRNARPTRGGAKKGRGGAKGRR